MGLSSGARLGPYEIVAPIGAGGMGEVYRARDTRLDRTVAIKVLPESLAADPQLRERFDREARAISALNHPHICTLYDVGHQDGIDFLVLEYLEGETLDARLKSRDPGNTLAASAGTRGSSQASIGADEALAIAIQIADALDRAHRSGIVHRDLKPANIMLTRSGAKLLDFGLAKNAAPAIATSGLSMAPTTPPNLTAQGTILGTFQYMAPEQIEGVDADARTDIFAFGAVLFEMLTGRPAFEGKTRAQLLGAILKDEPPPVSTILDARLKPSRSNVTALDRIVATCLAKDPDDRWQSARDLLRELTWASAVGPPDGGLHVPDSGDRTWRPASAGPALWAIVGALVIALAASGALALRHLRETPSVAEPLQFTIPAPENSQFGGPLGGGSGVATQLAVSPDGRHVMFVARKDGTYGLWLRPIASLSARQLPGTEDASFPFWSPDSRYVAFFAGGKLKKAQISGGPPVILCDAAQGRGGTWNRDNIIVFGLLGSSLQRVSSAGGTPVAAAQLDTAYGETSHRWPHFLPDGQHFLFTTVTGALGAALKPSVIRIGALGSLDATTLLQVESSVAYASGHLLFVRNGSLLAQQFDVTARHLTGDSYPVAEQVLSEGSRYASFSTSPTGVLAYAHGSRLSAGSRLVWFDRTGRTTGQLGELAPYLNLALSPDERRVAVTMATGSPPNGDIWTIDVARGVSSRLTFDPALESLPIWSPDSSRVVFQSLRIPDAGLRQKLASGTSDDGLVFKAEGGTLGVPVPADWSRDGRFIAYDFQTGTSAGSDIWILPLSSGDKRPYPFVQGPGPDTNAAFSRDGHWIAYQAFDSGAPQVYVQPFPPTGGRFQVSKESGLQPQWRGDGKELFFLANDGSMWAAPIDTAREFQAGLAQRLFETGAAAPGRRQYAVTKDGQRFLVLVPRSSERNASPEPLTVVVNWLAGVQK
jgi:eukaryotic-like serine/threonine-protein kinase